MYEPLTRSSGLVGSEHFYFKYKISSDAPSESDLQDLDLAWKVRKQA